jgi:hypothetical protein
MARGRDRRRSHLAKRRNERSLRSLAVLVAKRSDGTEVERHEMALSDCYEELHQIIDSSEYRAARGIRVLEGLLHDSAGKTVQEFQNRHAADG